MILSHRFFFHFNSMHHKKSKMATSESNATILKFSYVHVYIVLVLTSFQFEKGLNYSHTKEKKTSS